MTPISTCPKCGAPIFVLSALSAEDRAALSLPDHSGPIAYTCICRTSAAVPLPSGARHAVPQVIPPP